MYKSKFFYDFHVLFYHYTSRTGFLAIEQKYYIWIFSLYLYLFSLWFYVYIGFISFVVIYVLRLLSLSKYISQEKTTDYKQRWYKYFYVFHSAYFLLQAVTVFFISIATVRGHTHPGTGVTITPQRFMLLKSVSP